MRIRSLNIYIQRGGPAEFVNVASVPDITATGKLSLLGRVQVGRSFTGPFGHQDSALPKISLISQSSEPFPLDMVVNASISFVDEVPGGGGSTNISVMSAWLERDTVTRYKTRGTKVFYRHDLDLVDAIGVLAGIPAPDCPAQTISDRLTALSAATTAAGHGYIGPGPGLIPGRLRTTPLAASNGSDVLTAYRAAADSIGYRLVTNINGGATMIPHALALSPAPNWWQPVATRPDSFRALQLRPDQIEEVPIALSRLSHVSTVQINRQVAGSTLSDVMSDGRRYGTYQADTQIVLGTAGATCPALDDLRAFASNVVSAPVEPAPTTAVAVTNTGEREYTHGVLYEVLMHEVAVVQVQPDDRLPRFLITAGYALTIEPDLSAELDLALYPASLYGLVATRSSYIGSARHTDAYTPIDEFGNRYPIRFHNLACNRRP